MTNRQEAGRQPEQEFSATFDSLYAAFLTLPKGDSHPGDNQLRQTNSGEEVRVTQFPDGTRVAMKHIKEDARDNRVGENIFINVTQRQRTITFTVSPEQGLIQLYIQNITVAINYGDVSFPTRTQDITLSRGSVRTTEEERKGLKAATIPMVEWATSMVANGQYENPPFTLSAS